MVSLFMGAAIPSWYTASGDLYGLLGELGRPYGTVVNVPLPLALYGLGAPELIIIVFCGALLVHWLYMVVAACREPTTNRRIAWVLVVVVLPLGQFVYQIVRWSRPRPKLSAAAVTVQQA